MKHPFPGIEFEGKRDFAIVEIDEAAFVAPSDGLDIEQCGLKAGLPCGILEIGKRAGVLGVVERSREMQAADSVADLLPCFDQAFMQRVELVGAGGKEMPLDPLLEPGPLKDRRLENRGRRIRVIFQEFCGTAPAEAQVEPAIKAALVAVPAVAEQRPECLRYPQPAEKRLVVDDVTDEFKAHRIDLSRRRLDLTFDFLQREGVKGAFVPIALAVNGVKI